MSAWNLEAVVAVAAGAFITLLLAGVVLYWIDRERREIEDRRERRDDLTKLPSRSAGTNNARPNSSSKDSNWS